MTNISINKSDLDQLVRKLVFSKVYWVELWRLNNLLPQNWYTISRHCSIPDDRPPYSLPSLAPELCGFLVKKDGFDRPRNSTEEDRGQQQRQEQLISRYTCSCCFPHMGRVNAQGDRCPPKSGSEQRTVAFCWSIHVDFTTARHFDCYRFGPHRYLLHFHSHYFFTEILSSVTMRKIILQVK